MCSLSHKHHAPKALRDLHRMNGDKSRSVSSQNDESLRGGVHEKAVLDIVQVVEKSGRWTSWAVYLARKSNEYARGSKISERSALEATHT